MSLVELVIFSTVDGPKSWFDTVPRARIISRCTTDMESIDEALPTSMENLMQTVVMLSVSLVAVVWIAGWQALVLGSVVAVVGSFCANIYLKAQLCVKRENSNAKSPGMVNFRFGLLFMSGRYSNLVQYYHTFMPPWEASVRCSLFAFSASVVLTKTNSEYTRLRIGTSV